MICKVRIWLQLADTAPARQILQMRKAVNTTISISALASELGVAQGYLIQANNIYYTGHCTSTILSICTDYRQRQGGILLWVV